MKKNKTIAIALSALFTSSIAIADVEVTGKLILENASFQNNGAGVSTIGNYGSSVALGSGANVAGTCTPADMFNADGTPNMSNRYCGVYTTATPENNGENFKEELGVRLYIDGDITDNSTFHVELQGQKAQSTDYNGSADFTQRDPIRELYTDISGGAWDARIGKQQIVWGTADGMKLLDIVNPTDYAEMAQNQMEDSRIPVWAVNLEKDNIQVVVSQPKENVFAGINRGTSELVRENNMFLDDTTLNNGTDTGNPFMMMGPDTITGVHNGFLNITPDMGSVASRFSGAFDPVAGGMGMGNLDGAAMQGFTVDLFESLSMANMSNALWAAGGGGGACPAPGHADFGAIAGMGCIPYNFQQAIAGASAHPSVATTSDAVTGAQMLAFGFAPMYNTNLANMTAEQDTAFDFMGNTTFRTFNSFVNAKSQYKYNMPKGDAADFGIKSSHTTKNGVNYSLNLSNSYDKNPIINLSWRGDAGQKLETYDSFCPAASCGQDTTTVGLADPGVDGVINFDPATQALDPAGDDIAYGGSAGKAAILQFEQAVVKTKNIGASFDTTYENPVLGPVVIRGEALYTTDGKSPVIDKDRLAVGDMVGALKMVDADRFKYVFGVDITVLTNMLVSGQFIADYNLDYVDNGNKYTADYATMHLSNQFNKAIEDKNFYSLFFSKPFGASGQHRWNNITMLEEGAGENGYWNRFDVDWGLSDDVQGTFELNNYWGNSNTQFGQIENASNMQVGMKYSF